MDTKPETIIEITIIIIKIILWNERKINFLIKKKLFYFVKIKIKHLIYYKSKNF